jgi:hypothetical protein
MSEFRLLLLSEELQNCRSINMSAEEYFDSHTWNIGFTHRESNSDVWWLPVIGHAVIVSDGIRTVPITLESEDYSPLDFIDMDEDEKLKQVLPPLPCECFIMAYVPAKVPLDQIINGTAYPVEEVKLCHCCTKVDWEPLFRKAWLAGVIE